MTLLYLTLLILSGHKSSHAQVLINHEGFAKDLENKTFTWTVQKGWFHQINVDQCMADLVLEIRDETGALIVSIDRPVGRNGREWYSIIPDKNRQLLVRLIPFQPQAGGGYRVHTLAHPAREIDFKRVAVETHLWRTLPLLLGPMEQRGDALPELEQLILDFLDLEEPEVAADLLVSQGSLERKLGFYAISRQHAWEAADQYFNLGQFSKAARALQNAGVALHYQFFSDRTVALRDQTLHLYYQALDLLEQSPEHDRLANLYSNIAGLYQFADLRHLAWPYFERALSLADPIGDPSRTATLHNNLAVFWTASGDHQAAFSHLEQAIKLLKQSHEETNNGTIYNNMANHLRALERYHQAHLYYQEALNYYGDTNPEMLALIHLGRARTYLDQNNLPAADKALTQGLAQPKGRYHIELEYWRAQYFKKTGANQSHPKDPFHTIRPAMLEHLDRALALVPADGHALEPQLWAAKAQLAEAHDPVAARDAYTRALHLVEDQRAHMRAGIARDGFYATRWPIFADAIGFLSQSADPADQALAVATLERGRGKSLREVLRRGALSRRPLVSMTALADYWNHNTQDPLVIQSLNPHIQIPEPDPLTLPQIQAMLPPDTLLIATLIHNNRLIRWWIDHQSVTTDSLSNAEEIQAWAESFYNATRHNQPPDPTTLSRLTQALLPPPAQLGRYQRFAFFPDPQLQAVPFAALPVTDSNGQTRPLIQRGAVVHLPVIAALTQHPMRHDRPPTLALFADPVFQRWDPRGATAATRGDPMLLRLPGTGREAEAVAALTAFRDIPPTLYLGPNATLDHALDPRLGQYRFLHFATHGLMDPDRPERSCLVLTRFDPAGEPLACRLDLSEITAMKLDADLVVLSACESAVGRAQPGEGLQSLARSFMLAGADRVIGSLWPVADSSSPELMERFYRFMLEQHLAPAEALAAAQRELQQIPKFSKPYFWAGFIYMGP